MMDILFSLPLLQAQVDDPGGGYLEPLLFFAFVFGPLLVIFFISRAIETAHFRELAKGEHDFRDILISDMAYPMNDVDTTTVPHWVASEVTVSSSRIKDFFARWRSFFGGEIRSYQTLQERALREARLRLCREAQAVGCDAICNVRFTAAQVSMAAVSRTKDPIMIAMQASGTAYVRRTN